MRFLALLITLVITGTIIYLVWQDYKTADDIFIDRAEIFTDERGCDYVAGLNGAKIYIMEGCDEHSSPN